MSAALDIDTLVEREKFVLPGTAVRDLPFSRGDDVLNIGLVEIGCKPRTKYGQLQVREDVVNSLFLSDHPLALGEGLSPNIFKTLVHFQSDLSHKQWVKGEFSVDARVVYDTIPDRVLATMPLKHRKRLLRAIPRADRYRRAELREIIEEEEGAELHRLITDGNGLSGYLGHSRGRMAEVVVQWEFERALPDRMKLYRNQTTDHPAGGYVSGVEFDSLLVFYDGQLYTRLIENLRKEAHLDVKACWDEDCPTS